MKNRYNQLLKRGFLLFFVLLHGLFVFSQSAKNKNKLKKSEFDKLHKLQKEDTESEFSNNKIPEQYKFESMVVLAEKTKIFEDKFTFYNYHRIRIKLNDLSALENYSEYKFYENDILEIKIIKQNKTTITLDLAEAVDAENVKTSNIKFNKLIDYESKLKKIAIGGLEIGDIIDISSRSVLGNFSYRNNYFVQLAGMPIVYLKNEFIVGNYFQVTYKSFNGAKEITKENNGNKIELTYEQKMIDKRLNELLDQSLLTDPYYFIEIRKLSKRQYKKFKISKEEIANKITPEEIKRRMVELFKPYEPTDYYYEFYKSEDIYKLSDEDFVKHYFYFCRDIYFLPELAFNVNVQSFDYQVIKKFITHLKKRNIPFEVLLLSSKYDKKDINEVVNFDDFKFGLRYKINNQYHYITTFYVNSEIDEIGEHFEGTVAFVFNKVRKKRKINYYLDSIPTLDASKNIYAIEIEAKFNKNLDSLNVLMNSTVTGIEKNKFNYNLINSEAYFNKFIESWTNNKFYKYTYFLANNIYLDANKEFFNSEEERLKKNVFTKLEKQKLENIKNNTNSEYDVLKYHYFKSINDGRNLDTSQLLWQEYFTVGNTLQKAGAASYIFEIGSLLGKLSVVSNNENRNVKTKPFFINYSRNLSMKIVVKIPNGKKVQGLENLNVNFKNKIGAITSKANIENGNLVWTFTKTQNAFKYNKTDWNEYLILTDLASQLNNAKLIFN